MIESESYTNSNLYFHQEIVNLTYARIELSEGQKDILLLVSRILAGFSIFSSILVLFVFWFFRSIRTFAFELVASLTFSCLLLNISIFITKESNDNQQSYNEKTLSLACKFQSFFNIFFELTTMMWSTLIGYTSFISVKYQNHLEVNKMRYRIGFIIIAYLPSLIFTIIVLVTGHNGPSGFICFIALFDYNPKEMAYTIIFYAWTWLIILFNCFFIIKVMNLLKSELKDDQNLVDKYSNKLKLYPLVQIISFIPATINRIYNMCTNNDNFTLTLIQCIFDNSDGLMFAFVYGFNNTVRGAISDSFKGIILKFRRGRSGNSATELEDNNSSKCTNSDNRRTLSFIDDSFMEK